MARLGVAKVKTGCVTCKIRRVKCDEARPACNRCVSTGRRCDGYVTPPTGTYSWAQLLRVHPPPTQAASDAELRALSFFRKVVAPVLSGPLDSYFWTHLVSQVSHQELAAKHAALAISSLYEKFKEDPLDRHSEKNSFAVAHYNEAIKHLRTTNNQETVLFVCILFVCIDMLRGECKGAIDHCRHGINILNGSRSTSRFVREHLTPAFCRLGVFPFFFGARPETFPAIPDSYPAPVPPFYNLKQVQAALDPLLVRAIRFVRAADEYRLGDETHPKPDLSIMQERDEMDELLDDWAAAFQAYMAQKSPNNCQRAAMREELVERLLEMKWHVGKIWLSTCFSRGELVYDLHLDKFQRIIELGREVEAIFREMWQRIGRAKFTFEMGFSPLLGFVFIKCRSLSLRIAALGLMKTIAHERENLWDFNTVLAFGRKIVEFEHELDLGHDEDIANVVDDGTLPPEGRRIKDSAMQDEVRFVHEKNGAIAMWKKVALLMREHGGPITVQEEWASLRIPLSMTLNLSKERYASHAARSRATVLTLQGFTLYVAIIDELRPLRGYDWPENLTYKDENTRLRCEDEENSTSSSSVLLVIPHLLTLITMHLSWIILAAAATALALPSGPSPTPTLPIFLAKRQDITVTSSTTSSIPTGDFIATKYITIPGVTNSYVTVPAKTIDIAIPTCVQTIEPDANGYIPPGECGAIWNYYPSFAAAAVFAALFGVLTVVHIWQAAKHKKRWCWVIIMASIWETLAFIFRAASSKNQQSNGIYLVFQIFILLAPIWVNAFAYMTLGRMIYFFHPSRSLLRIPAATFAAIFVALDIVSFAVQLTGGSMAGPGAPPAEQMKAIHIYMGGIGLQEFFILIFVALAMKFQVEMQSLDKLSGKQSRSWRPLIWALYFSLAMISVRIVYRLIEFSSGHGIDNVLITHEAYFYVLEALPMLLAIAVFNMVHPAMIINGGGSDMPGLLATMKHGLSRREGRIPLGQDPEGHELTRRSPSP